MDFRHIKGTGWFFIGLILCFAAYFPLFVFNTDFRMLIHDQLDGEVLTYVLNAKHFMDPNLPELFNGADKSSMTPPAPGFVLMFLIFPTKAAYFIMYVIVLISAYTGMYLCLNEMIGKSWIAAISSMIFTLLPFFPVYGLSVMGQPLLVYAFIRLWKGYGYKLSYFLIAFFAVTTSLILSGYIFVTLGAVLSVLAVFINREKAIQIIIGWLGMTIIYILTNLGLIKSILFPSEGFITHKTEWEATSYPIIHTFFDTLIHGVFHATPCSIYIMIAASIVFILMIIRWNRHTKDDKKKTIIMGCLLCSTLVVAGLVTLWKCEPVVEIRRHIGGFLVYFQADRIDWVYPMLWFFLLGFTLYFATSLFRNKLINYIVIAILVLINVTYILTGDIFSPLLDNYKCMNQRTPSGGYASIDEFYQPKMFAEIDSIINREKSDYRVCSIGIYPSIALYNGYYCIDGYSNNYDVNYKHRFRTIIADEMDKDDDTKWFFDTWGNRCYICSNELGQDYYVSKYSNRSINDLRLNYDAMKEMGCEYMFSAVPINNSPRLKLIHKATSDSSVYDVYVYHVE